MTLFTIHITENIGVLDLPFCKHEDLGIAYERKSISDSTSRLYHFFRNIIETISITEFLLASNPNLKIWIVAFQEIVLITERFIANTVGPSFRWRFKPWRKSSMDNDFDPPRHYPHIPIIEPVTAFPKIVNAVVHFRLPYIFPFKQKKEDET